MDSNSIVIKYLIKLGYNPQTDYYKNIDNWEEWYRNYVKKFHEYHDEDGTKRQLYRLNMAKRGCEDWSSILYTEKDVMTCDDATNQKYLDEQLERLKFDDVIPKNIENACWSGTVGTITRVKNAIVENGELKADEKTEYDLINVTAERVIPLLIEHEEIIDVAFVSKITEDDTNIYYIEIHELKEDGYVIRNIFINEKGEEVERKGVIKEYSTHSNIPLFSLLEPQIVNNIKDNNGLGISIFGNAIDQLKDCDIEYNNFVMDAYLGGKKIFYNKSLVKYNTATYTDKDGNRVVQEIPVYPDDLTKQQFRVLDGDLSNANENTLIHEYNPDLRAEDGEKRINMALNLYSFAIGLGKGYYRFENGTVVTATQYLGENKDLVGNAKKHRRALNSYTVGIARAILLLGRILFNENTNENDNIQLTNKDGFLVSDEELQEQYRQDFQAGLMSKKTYLMKARGMTEEQAIRELEEVQKDNPTLESLIGE